MVKVLLKVAFSINLIKNHTYFSVLGSSSKNIHYYRIFRFRWFMKQNQGFALIELLIAIATGHSRRPYYAGDLCGKQVTNGSFRANNLRQMYLALEQYANDSNGLLPCSNNSSSSGTAHKECTAEVWFKAVDRYLINSQLSTQRDVISQERAAF